MKIIHIITIRRKNASESLIFASKKNLLAKICERKKRS